MDMTASTKTDPAVSRTRWLAIGYFTLAMLFGFGAFAALFLGKVVSISAGATALCLILFFVCFDKGWDRWSIDTGTHAREER